MFQFLEWLYNHNEELVFLGTFVVIIGLMIIAWMSTHVSNESRGPVTIVVMDRPGRVSALDPLPPQSQHRRSDSHTESLLAQLPSIFDSESHLRHRRTGSNVSEASSPPDEGVEPAAPVMIRLKYLDDRMKTVYASLQESIRSFKM